jgi:hypothetical protein
MLTNSMLLESTPVRTQEPLAETDLSLAQIALRGGFSDQNHFSPVEKLDRFAQANDDKRAIHLALRWLLDRRAENGERRDVGDNLRLWETTHGNC